MSRRGAALGAIILGFAGWAACGKSSLPAPGSSTPPEDASVQIESPSEADADAPRREASGGPRAGVASDARRFTCGAGTCSVGSELCCASGPSGVCVGKLPYDAPRGAIGYRKSQWEACDTAQSSFEQMDECDESVDCPGAEICCVQFLFSGGSTSECTLVDRAGVTPCDYGERCVEGSTCRIPGTRCIGGYCKKPIADLRCGGAPCPAGFECTRDGDCIAGQRCVFEQTTFCTRFVPHGHYPQYVCERAADCPTEGCAVAPTCDRTDVPALKRCACARPS